MAKYIVEHSMIGLPVREGRAVPHKLRGELVSAEDLGDAKDRFLAAGAIREATAEEIKAAEPEETETPPVGVEASDAGPGTDTPARPVELERQEPTLGLPEEMTEPEPEPRRGPGRPRSER